MPWCGDIELDRKVLHKGRLLHIYFLKSRVQKPEQLLYISTMTCNYCGTICFIIWMSFFRKYFVKPRQLHSFSLHLHFFFFFGSLSCFLLLFIKLTVHIIMLFTLLENFSFHTWQKIPIYLQYLWNYIFYLKFHIPRGKNQQILAL